MAKLNNLSIQRTVIPGLYGDGNGLYLQVSETLTKSWLFRFSINGRSRAMGLGALANLSLSEARKEALEAKRKLLSGIDPIEDRKMRRERTLAEAAKTKTFEECANEYIAAHKPGWSNVKHVQQWQNTLQTYAFPLIGALPASEVDTSAVMKVLRPIWLEKTETASRLRGRIEKILGWSAVHGFREGDNPARWSGHLQNLLPAAGAVKTVRHFTALPIADLGTFFEKLREKEDMSALALEFCILTTTRTNETLRAKWEEFNLHEQMWTIPACRMKNGREHRVPLTPRLLQILETIRLNNRSEFVFESRKKRGSHLSDMSLLMHLRRMGYEVTTHGFRSSFSDWAAEKTNFPREVVEMQLAHTISSKVEAAYRRGDLYLKRRGLLIAWERFCYTIEPQSSVSLLHQSDVPHYADSGKETKITN